MFFVPAVLRTTGRIGCRFIHSSQPMKKTLEEYLYNVNGYNQYGLLFDDFHDRNDPLVLEAERRLPEEVKRKMNFRLIRANQLLLTQSLLPKEEWTKFDNEEHHYLEPYLQEVLNEKKERDEWNANY